MPLPLLPSLRALEDGAESQPFFRKSHAAEEADQDHWRPAFLADWTGATFVHFTVPAKLLQPDVPFPLDLYQGEACVSLVAFTMERMRPAWLNCTLGEWLLRPLAPCRFLNVRTYVRVGAKRGIYFLGEWLSRWANIPLGPLTYGLPYHAGHLEFSKTEDVEEAKVQVRSRAGDEIAFQARAQEGTRPMFADPGSLTEFLLERYYAFTSKGKRSFAFRVQHEPWEQVPAGITVEQSDLLIRRWSWFHHARLLGGHISAGVRNVTMSTPKAVAVQAKRRRSHRSAFCSE